MGLKARQGKFEIGIKVGKAAAMVVSAAVPVIAGGCALAHLRIGKRSQGWVALEHERH
ncbi:hypothetical protein OHB14_51180 [Streptomyces sp. NBC_01613]|uniref:hypothetical protein n=1 Tax=Streptomyces sp. NBC_01613 TaxID=2975896 RepID=UPI003870BDFD